MANKRMFSMQIVDSDAFLDMPLSAQCLYFHLNMRADDDGFVSNPKRIAKLVSAADDDLKILEAKNFVLTFENGVMVIKHWRIHNTLSSNRYKETSFIDEKAQLLLKSNGAYSFNGGDPINDMHLIEMSKRQSRRTKDEQKTDSDLGLGLDKELDIDSNNKSIKNRPDDDEVYTFFHHRGLTTEATDFLQMMNENGWKTKDGQPVTSWKGIATNYIKSIRKMRDSNQDETEAILDEIYGTD